MSTRRWERMSALFERASGSSPDERRALYARECADDPSLGREVERLIAADAREGGFLDAHLALAPAEPPAVGARVGRYTLVRRVAAGGMGVVYEAQQEGTDRRVAIKLVHAALTDDDTLRRFRYEAQALGRLRHAGIAQVYEAGVDVGPAGEERPFLAMELVEGARAVTTYAREERLSTERAVRLFVEVCHAVQHGHSRGVLHRDLKPSNVLVDATGAPKVIDFGIARVQDEQHTRATRAGDIVGTLAAMSPEQLEGDTDLVDAQSDVYALGAILYEMLCGAPPVDLAGLSLTEALDAVRRATPARPSRVRADLPLELEWIVLRALAPERDRRYTTAAELAADLERHLADEPVHASPPSRVYRARKFVRRNRAFVGGVAAVALALVAGAVVALVQRDVAIAARDRAESAEELARQRLGRIERESRANRELVRFQGRILGSANFASVGRDARVVDALERASLDLDAQSIADPRLWLTLRRSIAESYAALGLARETRGELRKMRPVWEANLEPGDRERLALERLELCTDDQFVPAAEVWERARAGFERAQAALGSDDEETARWMTVAGSAAHGVGRDDEGRSLHARAIETLTARFGARSPEVIEHQIELAAVLNGVRGLTEAEALARSAYEAARTELGEENGLTLAAEERVAWAAGTNGSTAEALALYDELVAAYARRTGPRSTPALNARLDRTHFLRRALRPAEALAEQEAVIADAAAEYGERAAFVHRARYWRAWTLVDLGRVPEAVEAFERAYAGALESEGPEDQLTLEILSTYAFNLFRLGRHEEALPLARDAWTRSARALGAESPTTLSRASGYAVLLANVGRKAEAVEVLEWLLAAQERQVGAEHHDAIQTLKNLAMIRLDAGDPDGALCSAQELVRRADRDTTRDPLRSAGAHWALGLVLERLDQPHEAAAQLALASDRWARSSIAGTEVAIFGLLDEARVQGRLGAASAKLRLLERAAALSCGSGLAPTMRARALTELAEGLLDAGDATAARALAEMIVAGSGEIEPTVRRRAERILDAG